MARLLIIIIMGRNWSNKEGHAPIIWLSALSNPPTSIVAAKTKKAKNKDEKDKHQIKKVTLEDRGRQKDKKTKRQKPNSYIGHTPSPLLQQWKWKHGECLFSLQRQKRQRQEFAETVSSIRMCRHAFGTAYVHMRQKVPLFILMFNQILHPSEKYYQVHKKRDQKVRNTFQQNLKYEK